MVLEVVFIYQPLRMAAGSIATAGKSTPQWGSSWKFVLNLSYSFFLKRYSFQNLVPSFFRPEKTHMWLLRIIHPVVSGCKWLLYHQDPGQTPRSRTVGPTDESHQLMYHVSKKRSSLFGNTMLWDCLNSSSLEVFNANVQLKCIWCICNNALEIMIIHWQLELRNITVLPSLPEQSPKMLLDSL